MHPQLQTVKERLPQFIELMRLNRPIGIFLLLLPTYWALWLAAEGWPSIKNFIIFTLGVIIMRSAGCVINDYADREVDGFVERTANRPLATGAIAHKEAIALFLLLCGAALLLVLLTNPLTVGLSLVALVLAASYPFMKRYTYLPQVVLGAAFGWAVPMAFAAELNQVPKEAWLVYVATLIWTVAYDTMYAMVDREDDLQVGIKSTAILFGEADRMIIGILQGLAILIMLMLTRHFQLGGWYLSGVAVAALLFVYQQYLIRERLPSHCFRAFLNNNWVGVVIFAGIVLHYSVN